MNEWQGRYRAARAASIIKRCTMTSIRMRRQVTFQQSPDPIPPPHPLLFPFPPTCTEICTLSSVKKRRENISFDQISHVLYQCGSSDNFQIWSQSHSGCTWKSSCADRLCDLRSHASLAGAGDIIIDGESIWKKKNGLTQAGYYINAFHVHLFSLTSLIFCVFCI